MTGDLVSKNQRRYRRVKPKAMSSRVRVAGTLHLGLAVENLSLGGAFIRCALNPPLQSHTSIELTVPGVAQPLLLSGKVAYLVSPAEATQRKVAPGFGVAFQKPLPVHVQRGLEHLLRGLDPQALEVLAPRDERTVTAEALPARHDDGGASQTELELLRKLTATHEREIERLRKENAQLRSMVKRLSS